MLHFIKGHVAESFENGVIIENNGIGYEVNVPSTSVFYLAGQDELVTVYTAMIVREDDVSLYGFDDRESLKLFRMLMTVSGVGAKAAISILSALTAAQVKNAIVFNEPEILSKAQGVGKKTAQRIVLELKDKIDKDSLSETSQDASGSIFGDSGSDTAGAAAEAVAALIALGYSKNEASDAVTGCGIKDADTQDYIKAALKTLAKF